MSGRPRGGSPTLVAAIDGYLLHLRVERGLAPATLRAYASDLAGFVRAPGVAGGWSASAEPATRYLARSAAGLRPSSLRRRAASIRGFYRFAYGDELIAIDLAARIDLPRQVRRLPETLDVGETERLLEATSGDLPDEPVRIRDRALLELLYAAGLRISEALGLDREDLSLDGGFVRVIGKGDRERLVPVGEVALDWLERYLDAVRPAWLGAPPRRATPRRAIVPVGPRPTAGPPAGLGDRPPGGRRGGPAGTGDATHPPPLVRDPSARGRSRPAGRPGVARACEYQHHSALYPSDRRTDPRRLRPRPPAGLKEARTRWRVMPMA